MRACSTRQRARESSTMSSPTRLLRTRRSAPLPNQFAPCTRCTNDAEECPHSIRDTPSAPALSSASSTQELSEDAVREYLRFHRDFLEGFILQDVTQDTLERLLIRRAQIRNPASTSLSTWKFCVHSDKQKLMQLLTEGILNGIDFESILYQLCEAIGQAVNADAFAFHILDASQPNVLVPCCNPDGSVEGKKRCNYIATEGETIPGYVAATMKTVKVNILEERNDPRFPKGPILDEPAAASILCVPFLKGGGEGEESREEGVGRGKRVEVVGVLELARKAGKPQFGSEDEEIVHNYFSWAAVALHSAHCHTTCRQQTLLNESLMILTRLMLEDLPRMDTIHKQIQSTATELVDADRTALFLVDNKQEELYAHVFSVSLGESECVDRVVLESEPSSVEDYISQLDSTLREVVSYNGKLVRFPIDKGVAGYVARTGQPLNIARAQNNEFFNPEVDEMTGYTTHTLLCAPLTVQGRVIGVLEAVNKNGSNAFKVEDEQVFQAFALFCGLIMHNSNMAREIRRMDLQGEVTTEVLSYHRQCPEVEFQRVRELKPPHKDQYPIQSFALDTRQIPADSKAHLAITMLGDLIDLSPFDTDCLLRFVLTVSRNYRPAPYHNWDHAFSVGHCMYTIMRGAPLHFSEIERTSLLIACFCHDLDHRGYNNAFFVKMNAPLATLYSSSLLENHHFNQTLTLLQIPGHNIFSHLAEQDYKKVLAIMKKAILATDLARFFGNKDHLQTIVSSGEFSWENQQHRELVHCLMMTASDVCSSCKPWETHRSGVEDLFKEFYHQGDEEKARGLQPLKMMDRDFRNELPSCQMGFLKNITYPCCELLTAVLPNINTMLQGAQNNSRQWESVQETYKG